LKANVFSRAQDADLLIAKDGQRGAVEPDADALDLSHLFFQSRGDVNPARPGVNGIDRAKETVCLQHQLAAQPLLVVHQQRLDAALAQLDGGRKPCRPSADDEHRHADLFDVAHRWNIGHARQLRQTIRRFNLHAGPHEFHARLDRLAVSQHQALSTLAVGAKDALGRAVFGMMAKDSHAICK
jgi:hypothetical protein